MNRRNSRYLTVAGFLGLADFLNYSNGHNGGMMRWYITSCKLDAMTPRIFLTPNYYSSPFFTGIWKPKLFSLFKQDGSLSKLETDEVLKTESYFGEWWFIIVCPPFAHIELLCHLMSKFDIFCQTLFTTQGVLVLVLVLWSRIPHFGKHIQSLWYYILPLLILLLYSFPTYYYTDLHRS